MVKVADGQYFFGQLRKPAAPCLLLVLCYCGFLGRMDRGVEVVVKVVQSRSRPGLILDGWRFIEKIFLYWWIVILWVVKVI